MPELKNSLNLHPSLPMRLEARLPLLEKVASFSLLPSPGSLRPVRIAVVGNHVPRQCGIATFTTDLCDAITAEYGASGLRVTAVNDPHSSYAYPARVRNVIAEGDISSYRAASNSLNAGNVDLVCLQHEYGIFGGKAGSQDRKSVV